MAKFVEMLKELSVPRIILIIFVVASATATALGVAFTLGLRAQDLSNRLASVQTSIGEIKGQLTVQLPVIQGQLRDQDYKIGGLEKAVATMTVQANEARVEVNARIDAINKERVAIRTEIVGRLSALEAGALSSREDLRALSNTFSSWLLEHHAELSPRRPYPQRMGER